MRRIFTIVSALLITAGLKAQNSNVQKETTKPVTDINKSTKKAEHAPIKKSTVIKNTTAKDANVKNAAIKNVVFKNTEIKKAPEVKEKAAPAKQ